MLCIYGCRWTILNQRFSPYWKQSRNQDQNNEPVSEPELCNMESGTTVNFDYCIIFPIFADIRYHFTLIRNQNRNQNSWNRNGNQSHVLVLKWSWNRGGNQNARVESESETKPGPSGTAHLWYLSYTMYTEYYLEHHLEWTWIPEPDYYTLLGMDTDGAWPFTKSNINGYHSAGNRSNQVKEL